MLKGTLKHSRLNGFVCIRQLHMHLNYIHFFMYFKLFYYFSKCFDYFKLFKGTQREKLPISICKVQAKCSFFYLIPTFLLDSTVLYLLKCNYIGFDTVIQKFY